MFWDEMRSRHRSDGEDGTNWWMNPEYAEDRRKVAAHVCREKGEKFFETSFQYNAMQGGRFNPSKSFGVLYCASEPAMAAFEVLFHLFADSQPVYLGMSKSSPKISGTFNAKVPDKIQVIIPVFEISLKTDCEPYSLCDSVEALKADCKSVGFRRYLGPEFTRDFIFGNDYEISRILGCHLHTKIKSTFSVPSARIDFDLQDKMAFRNLIVPEKDLNHLEPKLTGNFIEFRCEISMEASGSKGHKVKVECFGKSEASCEFYLQCTPTKKIGEGQTIRYPPSGANIKDKNSFSRVVQIQKFFIPPPDDDET